MDDAGELTHTSKKTISTHTNSKNAVNTQSLVLPKKPQRFLISISPFIVDYKEQSSRWLAAHRVHDASIPTSAACIHHRSPRCVKELFSQPLPPTCMATTAQCSCACKQKQKYAVPIYLQLKRMA